MATRDLLEAEYAIRSRKRLMPAAQVPARVSPLLLVSGNPNRLAFYFQNLCPVPLYLSNVNDGTSRLWSVAPMGGDQYFYYTDDLIGVTDQVYLFWTAVQPVKFFWYELEAY